MIRKDEFEKLLMRNDLREYMLSLPFETVKELFGEEYALMRDFSQNNPHHCYKLMEHILYATENLDIEGLDTCDALELKAAAFFHDIGKPRVVKQKEGRCVYYGHAPVSCIVSRKLLEDIGYEGEQLERICFYIEYHDIFIAFKQKDEITIPQNQIAITKDAILKVVRKSQQKAEENGEHIPSFSDYAHLMRLCRADAKAQARETYMNGVLIDTSERKMKRAELIRGILKDAAKLQQ